MLARKTLAAIDEHLVTNRDSDHRHHLGGSVIGDPCGRKLWLGFKWCKKPDFPPNVLRLFQRGHDEESRFVRYLTDIGCQVWDVDSNGEQFHISDCQGHFGGSLDGVAIGVPDVPPNTPTLLEFKTHGDKSFKKLVEDGLMGSKYQHFVQMQVYMEKMELEYGLYMAVNKDNDKLHLEIVRRDTGIAKQFLNRAGDIITAEVSPRRVGKDGSWWQCRFCDFTNICHKGEAPEKNCRTCAHSSPSNNAKWECGLGAVIVKNNPNKFCGEVLDAVGCNAYQVDNNLRF